MKMNCKKLNAFFNVEGPDYLEIGLLEKNMSSKGSAGIYNAFYGMKHTESTKKELSEIMKLKCKNDEIFRVSRINYGEKNGMFGSARFGSLNPMYGKSHSAETKKKQSESAKNRIRTKTWKLSDAQKLNISNKNSKTYKIKHPNGDILTITNLTKYCKENGLNGIMMSRVSRGVAISHKGYTKP